MSRTVRFAFLSLTTIGALLLTTFGPVPAALAAGATFVVGNGYISRPYQAVTRGGSVRIYNGDRVAHHMVSYTGNSRWGLDVVLAAGGSVTVAFAAPGTYAFRAADQSTLTPSGGCSGSCAAVSVY